MTDESKRYLIRQFDTAWKLANYHLDSLTTEECLWRPAEKGLHVYQIQDGSWHSDWPESEGYDLGPPSIAWLTWHLGFWWSMTINHSFGDAQLLRENVIWPGDAAGVRAWISGLQVDWDKILKGLTGDDLQSARFVRWPFQNRPLGDLVAWVNMELTKNAAEIGYARFLYAVSSH